LKFYVNLISTFNLNTYAYEITLEKSNRTLTVRADHNRCIWAGWIHRGRQKCRHPDGIKPGARLSLIFSQERKPPGITPTDDEFLYKEKPDDFSADT
jgi:hypothetical protein